MASLCNAGLRDLLLVLRLGVDETWTHLQAACISQALVIETWFIIMIYSVGHFYAKRLFCDNMAVSNKMVTGDQRRYANLGIVCAILILVPWTHGATLCVENGNGEPRLPSVYGHGWHRDCVWSTATEPGDTDGGILGLAFEICTDDVYHLRQAVGGFWSLNDTSVLVQYIERAGGYESYAIIQFIGEQMNWVFCYHVYILITEPYYHTGGDFLEGFGFQRNSPFWTLRRCCDKNRTVIDVDGPGLLEKGLDGNLDFVTRLRNPFSRPWICGKKQDALSVFTTPNLEIPLWPNYTQTCHYEEEGFIRNCNEYRMMSKTPEECVEDIRRQRQEQKQKEKERQELCKQLSEVDPEFRNEKVYQERCGARTRERNEL